MASILLGNIKGPKGDTGPQGPQGESGPVGPQGPLPPLINNALATEAGVAALDAVMGKTLQDQIDTANSNLNALSAAAMKYQYFNGTVAAGVANGSIGFVSAEMVKPDGYKLACISCAISSSLGIYAIYTRLNGTQLRAGFLNYSGVTTDVVVDVYAVAIYVPL